MLESLDNRIVGEYRLRVESIGRARFFDQRDFALYLSDARGNSSSDPVFRGRYNAGRPSIYVPSWIDGEFVESAREFDAKLAEEIARALGTLIAPGGRMWFAYESFAGEGELMRETRAALAQRVPLLATPIGYLLFCADCWIGLRDWDIPEGGREGPRKLQGNKALNAKHAQGRAAEIVRVLEPFSRQDAVAEVERRAQKRAKITIPALRAILMGVKCRCR
jgi:hypothetical protein